MFKDRNTIVSLDTVSLQEAEYIREGFKKKLPNFGHCPNHGGEVGASTNFFPL